MFKKVLLLMFLTSGVSYSGTIDVTKDPNFIKTYTPSKGQVEFNHGMHSGIGECMSCHKIFSMYLQKDLGHRFCKECHTRTNGPTICTGCHKHPRWEMFQQKYDQRGK